MKYKDQFVQAIMMALMNHAHLKHSHKMNKVMPILPIKESEWIIQAAEIENMLPYMILDQLKRVGALKEKASDEERR